MGIKWEVEIYKIWSVLLLRFIIKCVGGEKKIELKEVLKFRF